MPKIGLKTLISNSSHISAGIAKFMSVSISIIFLSRKDSSKEQILSFLSIKCEKLSVLVIA